MCVSDLFELLNEIQRRVTDALQEFTGVNPEIADTNARIEPRRAPYARVGIVEAVHSDFTISSDSLMVGLQIIAVVPIGNRRPQETQFKLAQTLHSHLLGESYEKAIVSLSSGRIARLMPATKTSFISDIEQVISEIAPDCTSVTITMTAEIPLGGKSF